MKTLKINELANVPVGETGTFQDPTTGEMVTVLVKMQSHCKGCHFLGSRKGCYNTECEEDKRTDGTPVAYERIPTPDPDPCQSTEYDNEPKFTQKDLELCVTEYKIDKITIVKHLKKWFISLGCVHVLSKDNLLFEIIPLALLREKHLFNTALEAAIFWFDNKEKN